MRRIITYAIDDNTGLVVSRVGSELAWPILDYVAMVPDNNFTPKYRLEVIPVTEITPTSWHYTLTWTRKVPVEVKNLHRRFWGMSELKGPNK
jgi:hypothetical protein